MQKITTHLWFDNNAEEAVRFYVSLFPDSKIISEKRYDNSGPNGDETVYTATFQLAGQQFMALNGGPYFKFNEAISLVVDCPTQAEVDDLWAKLTADGGEESQCGWLKDKFGLSWQIVPSQLEAILSDPDAEAAKRAMHAMLKMRKLDIAALQSARDGA
jgi:predicted 3-demethylubiquinone-9 3-methyltransferase (glyoxalase superfamily)